ncbi:hypothetical protein ACOMHN_056136 [Nucella lapillus]
MDLSFIKQIGQQVLIDSKSYLSREVYQRIRQLGLCKKPRTARHCQAGRLHRLWHNLPPVAPAQHNVTPATSTTDLPDTTPADNNPPLLPALTLGLAMLAVLGCLASQQWLNLLPHFQPAHSLPPSQSAPAPQLLPVPCPPPPLHLPSSPSPPLTSSAPLPFSSPPSSSAQQLPPSPLCLNNAAPVYLTNLLNIYTPSRTLRSASDPLILRTPRTKLKSFGPRAFSVSGPLSWNKLPLSVRQQSTFSTFKTSLKPICSPLPDSLVQYPLLTPTCKPVSTWCGPPEM